MIDLFRPFVAPEAREMVAATLTPSLEGRLFIGEGPKVEAFEHALGDFLGTPEAPLAVNSCTSALDLALHLCGVGPGDEVISTPMTCTATNGVIVRRGARIVWADVDPLTGLINSGSVSRNVTSRTKAIMAVDWGGAACDYTALDFVAHTPEGRDIPIIEDAAHNLRYDPLNHGTYVCWSFQAIKHLTTGDGGALLTPPAVRERARLLRWYGLDRTSSADFRCAQNIQEAGYKYHLNDIAATIGLANLPHVARLISIHQANAAWMTERLANGRFTSLAIYTPEIDERSPWWLYTLLVSDRESFIPFMALKGIQVSPVHARNDTHVAFHFPNGPLPGVDSFAAHAVAIPIGWWLTDDELEAVAEAVVEWAVGYTSVLRAA